MSGDHDAPISVHALDHLVLRCRDVGTTLAWYVDRLGLTPVRVDEWRSGAAPFPSVRVDAGTIIDLVATPDGAAPVSEAGHLDHLCLVVDARGLAAATSPGSGLDVVAGPGERFGARGVATSVYVRDPDGLVVELRAYPEGVGAG